MKLYVVSYLVVLSCQQLFCHDEEGQKFQDSYTQDGSKDPDDISLQPRIFGGRPASQNQFPFMAAIMNVERLLVRCGASIVAASYLVSAAHCFSWKEKVALNRYSVLAGITNLNDSPVKRRIDTIFSHELYNPSENSPIDDKYDIAVVKVNTPYTFNERVQPIPLPDRDAEPGRRCQVMGWGVKPVKVDQKSISQYVNTNNSDPGKAKVSIGELPRNLQVATVIVKNKKMCAISYYLQKVYNARKLTNLFDPKLMICVANNRSVDACKGDSGGPLVCGGVLHGIVAYNVGCAHQLLPNGYTNVYKFVDWITKIIS